MPEPKVGDPAPDFTLPNQDNVAVSLSALRGRAALLVFYPLDFTSTCTEEVCALRDDYQRFLDRGITVLGISRDSRHSHRVWKEQEGLPFDLLSDMRGETARAYGVWLEDKAYANRVSFLVDAAGHIAGRVGGDVDAAPDHSPLLQSV